MVLVRQQLYWVSMRQALGCAFFLAVTRVFYELGRASSVLTTCSTSTEILLFSPTAGTRITDPVTRQESLPSPSSSTSVSSMSSSSAGVLDRWESNTVIITISFGKATETKLLERLVYSIWRNGKWKGPVFVLTDQAERYRKRFAEIFATTHSNDLQEHEREHQQQNLIILQSKPDHLHPVDYKTGKSIPFIHDSMRFKRFKTLVFDYLDEHYQYRYIPPPTKKNWNQGIALEEPSPRPPFENVLYFDVEIVVARPLVSLLQDYQDQMIQRGVFVDAFDTTNETLTSTTTTTTTTTTTDFTAAAVLLPASSSFMSLFSDCPKCARHNFNLNSGVLLLHYTLSRPCLEEWQSLFTQGADYSKADQRYLAVMKTQSNRRCKFWQLPDYHRLYPTRREMRLKQSSTIVHNTNTYQATRIPLHVQQAYFSYLMGNLSWYVANSTDGLVDTF